MWTYANYWIELTGADLCAGHLEISLGVAIC
jgi:hypothetical protein